MEEREGGRWAELPTEARHGGSASLDTLDTEAAVRLLIDEDRAGLERARGASAAVARAAEWLAEALEAGGSAVFAGAGTSGRLGILEAAECPPTFGTLPRQIRAVMAGGADAVYRAEEGAEDREEAGRAVAEALGPSDLLVGLSASGVTPYVRAALGAARERGIRTVLVTCASPAGLGDAADLVVALDTGPEILTGSTRLKAGSATKAVLNAMTTAAMVRLGKVFGNLMVDVQATNAKLRDRARRIVAAAGEVSPERARELYDGAAGEIKTAIVMARSGVSADEARRRLAEAGGRVRAALGEPATG